MKSAYSYTVLRYVHDTATGEFVNVGVVLYAPALPYASAMFRTNSFGRVSSVFPGLDGEAFKRQMRQIQNRLEELGARLSEELHLEGKPDSLLSWVQSVLPADDSSLQWSPLGGGITADPARTLDQLYRRYVTHYDERTKVAHRDDDDVWRTYKKNLESRKVLKYLAAKKITAQGDDITFDHAWKNGLWHCLEPLSFDLSSAESIREKAHKLLGRIVSVKDSPEPFKLYLLLGEPQDSALRPAYEKALGILRKLPVQNELIPETAAAEFTTRLAGQMESHEVEEETEKVAAETVVAGW